MCASSPLAARTKACRVQRKARADRSRVTRPVNRRQVPQPQARCNAKSACAIVSPVALRCVRYAARPSSCMVALCLRAGYPTDNPSLQAASIVPAKLFLARNAVAVTIHLGVRAAAQEEIGFFAGAHLGAVLAPIANKLSGCWSCRRR